MSRQLKFRAWFDGHMYEVAKLDFWGDPEQATCDMAGLGENGEGEELFDIYAGEVELMQYTGIKDKNGKEIYEGDIVKSVALTNDHNQRGATVISPIEYWNGNTCLSLTYVPYYPFCLSHDIEVIGNIYENPELLKDDQTGGTKRKQREEYEDESGRN